jgi:hypothetical protein
MSVRRSFVAVLAALLFACALQGSQFSSASFTATSTSPVEVQAAADWTPPTATVTAPTGGSIVSGAAQVTVAAADDRSAVASVLVQVAVADSGAWQTLCTDNVAPYSCAWATPGGAYPDGRYDLRATATDSVGLAAMSAIVTVRVANSVNVVLDPLPGAFRSTLALKAATFAGAVSVPATSISFEYRVSQTGTWTTITACNASAAAQATCTWTPPNANTAELYDVRAAAVVGATTYYDGMDAVQYDPVAPTVALTVPAGTLSGTVQLAATAGDDDSGVASVLFEYRRTGATGWITCGTDVDSPYTCGLNTTGLVNAATYEFRATATDAAGNATVSPTQTRTVDNTAASVSVTAPAAGSALRATVTVTADAFSTQGVTSVRIEARPAGGAWTPVCTDASSPYSCPWDTATVISGSVELRAVLTQGAGPDVTSAAVAVTVDNSALRALDVSATNVGAVGYVNAGDKVVLTYGGIVDLTTIKAGWTGTSTSSAFTLEDKNVGGGGADRIRFTEANLGQVAFIQNYVKPKASVIFAATMTAATQNVGGVDVTVVTVTIGEPVSTTNLSTSPVPGAMKWTPSALAKTPAGVPCSTTVATESGTSDKDL